MKDKKVTIVQVAERANVSTASVSRYLKDPTSIKAISAVRIKEAIKELQYKPNANARNLRRNETNIIGLVIPHLEYFFDDICRVVSDYFFNRGYITYICESDNDGVKEKKYVQQLISQRVDGIIIAPSGQNTMFFRDLTQNFRNIIAIDREEEIGCDIVLENHKENAKRLLSWELENHPHEKILLLFGWQESYSTRMCKIGVDEIIKKYNIDDNNIEYCYTYRQRQSIIDAINRLEKALASNNQQALILAFGSDILEFVDLEITRNYRNLQNRVHISGFAQENIADKIGSKYSYIIKNPQLLGVTAAELLMNKLQKLDLSTDNKIIYIDTAEKFVK